MSTFEIIPLTEHGYPLFESSAIPRLSQTVFNLRCHDLQSLPTVTDFRATDTVHQCQVPGMWTTGNLLAAGRVQRLEFDNSVIGSELSDRIPWLDRMSELAERARFGRANA